MTPQIAIQGIRGSFHHEAAIRFFGQGAGIDPCMSFREVTLRVAQGKSAAGILAVENSLVGGMLPNLSLIREAPLRVTGEIYMRISQHLMALPGQSLQDLREVHSHPMALMQCEDFFGSWPHIRLVESADTAWSAQDISMRKLAAAGAIGSARAAEIFGLEVIAPSIETNKENYTRFLVIGPRDSTPEEGVPVKASVAFVAPHATGSLARVLAPLAAEGANLSMLQSLPLAGRSWEYIFHADMLFEGAAQARSVLQRLGSRLERVWVMGIYPAGDTLPDHADRSGSRRQKKGTETNQAVAAPCHR